MNYIKISENDIANGPGVRVVLWVSGCDHNCKGCHNPQTHDYSAGEVFDNDALDYLIKCLSKPYIRGLTISGGDPMSPRNRSKVIDICRAVRHEFGSKKDIWIYTGNEFDLREYFFPVDVVVDGPYIESLRDISLPFRGSLNQRIIDVKKTHEATDTLLDQKIVIYDVDNK